MILGEDVDAEAEEVLNELNLLTEAEESLPGSITHVDVDSNKWNSEFLCFHIILIILLSDLQS